MSTTFKLFKWWLSKKNDQVALTLIKYIASTKRISLLMTAYNEMGILKHHDYNSGEDFFISSFLKDALKNEQHPVLFDVGANKGEITNQLYAVFPAASIHAFEPIAASYLSLKANCRQSNFKLNNIGLGIDPGKIAMYHYNDGFTNQHATVFPEVLTALHKKEKIVQEEITLDTVDNYCRENGISKIDFLKIDTEGNELNVLKGAQKMIASSEINIIQFEFNEMNIVSRVFLKDFYDLLDGYTFYRLNTQELIPLGNYSPIHEIFHFQNIIAIKSN
jgi:FkbM family methyltransferase